MTDQNKNLGLVCECRTSLIGANSFLGALVLEMTSRFDSEYAAWVKKSNEGDWLSDSGCPEWTEFISRPWELLFVVQEDGRFIEEGGSQVSLLLDNVVELTNFCNENGYKLKMETEIVHESDR